VTAEIRSGRLKRDWVGELAPPFDQCGEVVGLPPAALSRGVVSSGDGGRLSSSSRSHAHC
jgi:hypothetical protein